MVWWVFGGRAGVGGRAFWSEPRGLRKPYKKLEKMGF